MAVVEVVYQQSLEVPLRVEYADDRVLLYCALGEQLLCDGLFARTEFKIRQF